MIVFKNVTKKFPTNIVALEDVNIEIGDGEFVFIVGPSGAGKSTLLRLLTREYTPTSGQILVDTVDIAKLKSSQLPIYRRNVGAVFQDFKLLDDRTVFENVAMALEVRGYNDQDIIKEVEKTLKQFEIWDRRNLFPRQLSGGEAQRTAIARAVIGRPKILLADEPTGDLDPKTASQVLQLLAEVNSWGTTVIMATHNKDIVDSQKRRVISVKESKIIHDKKEGTYDIG